MLSMVYKAESLLGFNKYFQTWDHTEGPTENIVNQEDIDVGQGMWGEEVSYRDRRKVEESGRRELT